MFSEYEKDGLHLAYPENWTLQEEASEGGEASLQLTISSPNTAFWTLAIYPESRDLTALADQVVDALREEYPDLESWPTEEKIGDVSLTGHDVNFICLDMTNTARVRVGHVGASTLLMLAQAEDRELPTVDPVFRAIATSLLAADAR